MTTVKTKYVLDEQVGYLLRRASQRHAAIFQAGVPEGLTPTQFSALVRLAEVGPTSQNRLGRMTSMDVATIKGVVARLVEKGLVTVAQDADDKRCSAITLSRSGRRLIDALHEAGHAITDDTLKPLDASERRALLKLLIRLA